MLGLRDFGVDEKEEKKKENSEKKSEKTKKKRAERKQKTKECGEIRDYLKESK